MNILLKLQKGILIISSLLILLGLFITVTLRYVLKMDLFGIEELLLIPIFLLYFIGAAYGSYEKSHITADLLDSYIKNKKFKLWNGLITSLITVLVCLIITYWNTEYFIWSFNQGAKTSGWGIPLFIPHGTVLMGFILMSFYSLIHLYRQTRLIIEEMNK